MHQLSTLCRALAIASLASLSLRVGANLSRQADHDGRGLRGRWDADIVGRSSARSFKQLGQQVIVDIKPAPAARSARERSLARSRTATMPQLVSSHATAETMFKNRPYEVMRDFAPVSTIGTSCIGCSSIQRTTPRRSRISSPRSARSWPVQLCARRHRRDHASGSEMMKMQGKPTGQRAVQLAGGVEVLAGRIDMLIDQPASSETYVKAGKLSPLAVTSLKRIPTAPMCRQWTSPASPGYEAIRWFGLAFRRRRRKSSNG
jgi:hypothetical protein